MAYFTSLFKRKAAVMKFGKYIANLIPDSQPKKAIHCIGTVRQPSVGYVTVRSLTPAQALSEVEKKQRFSNKHCAELTDVQAGL